MPVFYKKIHGFFSYLLPLMLVLTAFPAAAQMKFGGSPFLRNDAILELGSGRKGLLLPRVSNTALSTEPLDTAAAGMLIFNTSDQSLYIKKDDGNTPWTRVSDGNNLALGNFSDLNLAAPQNGQLLRYNAGLWHNWTPDFITPAQILTFSGGDVTGNTALNGNIALNLRSSMASGGTFPKITYSDKGLVTGGTALSAADIVAGSANYIQNQVLSPQAAGFRINGAGTVKSLNVTDMAVNGGLLLTDNAGNVIQKTGQLVWDADNELGVGTGTPAAKLDVSGNFKLGASGTVLLNVYKTSVVSASLTVENGSTGAVVLTLSGIASLKLTDNVIVNPTGTIPDGLVMSYVKVTDAANKRVSVYFSNPASFLGPSRTLAAQTFYVTVIQN